MRKSLLFLLLPVLLAAAPAFAQDDEAPEVDKSPMDASYYPDNYPILKIQNKTDAQPIARVIYSRPQKNGRVVFGNLVEYGKIWRLGANEASEITFFQDVKIGKNKVPKGRYTIYALVEPEKWTLILNKDTDTWGAFKYNPDNDFLRYPVNVQQQENAVEFFSMQFQKVNNNLINLVMRWDTTEVILPIAF